MQVSAYPTNTTAASAAASAALSGSGSAVSGATLGQDDFLKLLVAQLSTQDPLNPVKDTDFIAQMAQFNSLELARSTQAELASLRSEQQMGQASGLLGRSVLVQTAPGVQLAGVVTGVDLSGATPQVVVNGRAYGLNQLAAVSLQPVTQP